MTSNNREAPVEDEIMTSLQFESQPSLLAPAATSSAPLRRVSRAARTRLAIISTYDDLCGIAAYTTSLIRQLRDNFAIYVFDLNHYFLLHRYHHVRHFRDENI